MTNLASDNWELQMLVLQLRTSEDLRLEAQLSQLANTLSQNGFNINHQATRHSVMVSQSGITPRNEKISCFIHSGGEYGLAVCAGRIELLVLQNTNLDEVATYFNELKVLMAEHLNFLSVLGISVRSTFRHVPNEWPSPLMDACFQGNLWANSNDHAHADFKFWEDVKNVSTPGRITLHIKSVKGHFTEADGMEFYESQIMKLSAQNHKEIRNALSVDIFEVSEDFEEPEAWDTDLKERIVEQGQRVQKYLTNLSPDTQA